MRKGRPFLHGRWLTVSYFQVDALEDDVLQVLNLVRSVKNTLAPINKIPPEVLSLIPNHWQCSDGDEDLIALTHVCHSWRELFTSCPLLWTRMDCTNVDKTKIYIERSKSSPLEIHLERSNDRSYREAALVLAATHVGRLRTISAEGDLTRIRTVLVKHFPCPVPSLKTLNIKHFRSYGTPPTLPNELFNGVFSSLHELCLWGGVTPLPWRGLPNLTTFSLSCVPGDKISITQLLDFLESAPHLRHITFFKSIPDSSNAPAKRLVSLPYLNDLCIVAQPAHSILLNHLSIPVGASLTLKLTLEDNQSPILSHLPKSLNNLNNISHITAINLCFSLGQRSVRLNGPSGELYIRGNWTPVGGGRIGPTGLFLRSLDKFDTSRIQWLTATRCDDRPRPDTQVVTYAIYQILHPMDDLRILTLTQCNNLPFILTLNPNKNPNEIVLCPKLKKVAFYIDRPDQLRIDELLSMAEERALRGAKLSGITIVGSDTLLPTKLSQLQKHVSHVEYKLDDAYPAWDALPGTNL